MYFLTAKNTAERLNEYMKKLDPIIYIKDLDKFQPLIESCHVTYDSDKKNVQVLIDYNKLGVIDMIMKFNTMKWNNKYTASLDCIGLLRVMPKDKKA
jgi:hypothetical protein